MVVMMIEAATGAGSNPWAFGWEALAAIGTLAAVIVALLTVRFEAKARRAADLRAKGADERAASADARAAEADKRARDADERERSEAARRIADERRARERFQAERVVAWIEWVVDQRYLGGGEVGHWRAHVQNASDLPVFDVAVVATTAGTPPRTTASMRLLPPEAKRQVDADFVADGSVDNAGEATVTLTFTDANGRSWSRGPGGELEGPTGSRS